MRHKYGWIIAVCLLTIGCGKPHYQESEFTPYTIQFQQATGKSSDNLYMHFATQAEMNGDMTMGECDDESEIKIVESKWNQMNEGQRTMLIFHELGHCLMNLSHDSNMLEDKYACPESVMYPNSVSLDCWDLHKDQYIQNLNQSS